MFARIKAWFAKRWSLVKDWKTILTKSWSVRLNLLCAALSAVEFALPYANVKLGGTAALTALVVSLCAALARIVAQPKMRAVLFPDSIPPSGPVPLDPALAPTQPAELGKQ